MTQQERRARRELVQPRRKTKVVESKRSPLCTCTTGNCKKHGKFEPLP